MTFQMYRLNVAWQLVQRGSGSAGVDRVTVDFFRAIETDELRRLQGDLRRGSYGVSPVKGFEIAKPDGGRRLLGLATVRDRVVQRFLLQGIYPRLEANFGAACHAYRPGYSIYTAVAQVMEDYRSGPAWVVKLDIQRFFDRLSWPILLGQLEGLGLTDVTVGLIEQHLKAGMVLRGMPYPMNRGVVQGSILSGALANLYLSEFDRTCWHYGIRLVRYGDDCVVVCGSWLQAQRVLDVVTGLLAEVALTVHPEKTRIIGPEEGFVFLGHGFRDGVAVAPVRKARASPEGVKPVKSGGGRPLACGITKYQHPSGKTANDNYWSDGMTTLYVTDQGAYVKVQNQQFQVFHQKELRIEVPVNRVSHVVLFGCCNLSHGAVSLALRRRIPVLYLASNGKYFGRLDTEGHAQVEYLTQQVLKSVDPGFSVRQARSIILGKLHNSRVLLQRLNRKRPSDKAAAAIAELPGIMEKVREAESIEVMMGHEGYGATVYFQAYATLLKGRFEFEKRTRRPPTDPVNSLMSLGYTLLSQNLHSMVETVGLHTHFGNLHLPQKNRPSLVCDLMEEFRAMVVDVFVAYLINSNIFVEDDFTLPDERGGVYLQPDALKKFLKHWEDKLQTMVVHPHTGIKVTYRRCFELQVWEYVQVLSGEREVYRPMVWEK
jgi:CRISP-associated protein Cas1